MKKDLLGSSKGLDLKGLKQVALVYRSGTPAALELALEITNFLREKKIKVFTAPEQDLVKGTQRASKKTMQEVGLVVALGGDGTYLRAVRLLDGAETPILGFNLGGLGFLTIHRATDAERVLLRAFSGDLIQTPRSMIDVTVQRKGKVRYQGRALNDLVIERGPLSQLINVAIEVDKHLVLELKADGLILSSPTGSTAYNLAAGGPIMHPHVGAWVVTPVAPHSLTSRPLIFPDQSHLRFQLQQDSRAKASLVVDGQKVNELSPLDVVVIQRSPNDHWIVREPDHNFFALLREKLKFGDRA